MAVVEMSKLNLVAMSYERDRILNSLQKTGAAEIKLASETQNTIPVRDDCEQLRAYLLNLEGALEVLSARAESYYKTIKEKNTDLKEVETSYSEFMSAKDKRTEMDGLVSQIYSVSEDEKKTESEIVRLDRTLSSARIYSEVKQPLRVEDTAHTRFSFGTVPAASKDLFVQAIEQLPLASYSFIANDGENQLVFVAAHRSEAEKASAVLQEVGFVNCPFDDDRTGEEMCASLKLRREVSYVHLNETAMKWVEMSKSLRDLKIYCDYVGFELEKAELSEKLRATQTTFLLEAYVPAGSEESVAKAISEASDAVYYEFTKPAEDEVPPTLLKNNKVVENFEAITNMYSPPSPREFDPNTVMAFFYSVFLGFIMADIGYGLLMILGGSFIWLKCRPRASMIGKLGGVFAVGGIFTIVWGFLFNSFFGFAILPFKVMPDLQGEAMSWSLAGISVPALLIVSMLIGVAQICTGYICLAVQNARRGKILDAIFDGGVWAVFSVGVELAIAGFVDEFNVSVLGTVGGIIAGASLVVAILTAGRKEKLLGKFTKGFGSAYGVINYASDILSYARLYGLMLAGAVIADIISSNSVSLISSGNVAFIIIGILIMLIGHIFNLAIGLLGAYIHDARLQYVEFYGRFYEGDGQLFSPLGSKHKYIYVIN